MLLNSLFKYFIPPLIQKNALRYSYAKNIVGSALIASVMAPGFALLYYFLNFPLAAGVLLLEGIIILAAVFLLKFSSSVELVRAIIVGSLALCLSWITVSLGGLISPASYWLILPPLVAIFFGGIKDGFLWGTFCVFTTMLLYTLQHFGFLLNISPINNTLLLQAVSICGLIIILIWLAYFFERGKREAAIEILNANKELSAKEHLETQAKIADNANLSLIHI